jgi:hypothetical protein
LNNLVFPFTLSYSSALGYRFTVGSSSPLLADLDFTPGESPFLGNAFNAAHNAIRIDLRAETAVDTTSAANLFDVDFALTGLASPVSECGSIPNTEVSTPVAVAGSRTAQLWIVVNRDLSTTTWQLSGKIQLARSGGSEEAVRLQIWSVQVSPEEAETLTNTCSCSPPVDNSPSPSPPVDNSPSPSPPPSVSPSPSPAVNLRSETASGW